MGTTWGPEMFFVQMGDTKHRKDEFDAEDNFWKKKELCELGASLLSLIKHDKWGLTPCAKSTELHYSFPFIFVTDKRGPQRQEVCFFPVDAHLRCRSDFEQKRIENGKRGQTVTKIYK
jgi:hypothetical protein